jgi:Lipocalin-like domain
MNQILIVTIMLALVLPADLAQTRTAVGIVGTWQLVSRIDRTSRGELVPEPELGSDPVALLIYDRAGHVAAQLMRRNRDTKPPTEPQASPMARGTNNSGASGGYDAYFGTYVLDRERRTVTHTLIAALVAADVGKRLTRQFRVTEDELDIWFSTTAADGREVTRTLKWKRVG